MWPQRGRISIRTLRVPNRKSVGGRTYEIRGTREAFPRHVGGVPEGIVEPRCRVLDGDASVVEPTSSPHRGRRRPVPLKRISAPSGPLHGRDRRPVPTLPATDSNPLHMGHKDESELLRRLRAEGARRLSAVRYRRNRSTIWSLTRGGTVLNLHEAYGSAPWSVVRCFAVIARLAGSRDAGARMDYRAAAARVRSWSGLEPALRRVRASRPGRRRASTRRTAPVPGPCCGTPEQRRYLRALFLHLNRTRFGGALPREIPLRLSSRMTSRLGQMRGRVVGHRRVVVEIALNEDLMLEGNDRERLDTLVHEMAHAADWLFDGGRGHGPTWRAWAGRAGCVARARARTAIRTRPDRRTRVTRVPPLPPGAPRSGRSTEGGTPGPARG